MSLVDKLIKTRSMTPPKVIVYGPAGYGKTTFAASANAVLLDAEDGAGAVPGLVRTPYLQTWPEMREWLVELASLEEPPPTVAIDTLDWLVQRIVEHVVLDLDAKGKLPDGRVNLTNTLGAAHGGFFKAREIVQNLVYRDVLPILNRLTHHGAAVLLLAHAANAKLTTPEGFNIQVAAPDLPEYIRAPFVEWADCIFYIQMSGDKRTLSTTGSNLIMAKNRYGITGELPLSWDAFMSALNASRPDQGAQAAASSETQSN